MREPFWWPMNEPPLPTNPVPNWELFEHIPVNIETPWELQDDDFQYHPLVAEGVAILREIGADSVADYFMELDRENESLHIRLKNLAEDMYYLERKLDGKDD